MKAANVTAEQAKANVEAGKDFAVFNYMTGDVISFHKSHESAMRKAAKLGYRHNVANLRAGYAF